MGVKLHRFTVRPGHLDGYLDLWRREVALLRRHGYTIHKAFVETDAEPKFTWLYSHPSPADGEAAVRADPETVDLEAARAPHVFRNTLIRPVTFELPSGSTDPGRLAIMRRYSIVGSWDEFLGIWRRIVPVRELQGFPFLFAVSDRPSHMFTWAFGFDGAWDDFPAAQRPYYRDPSRVALRGVFDYMADYSIHPARQLELPRG